MSLKRVWGWGLSVALSLGGLTGCGGTVEEDEPTIVTVEQLVTYCTNSSQCFSFQTCAEGGCYPRCNTDADCRTNLSTCCPSGTNPDGTTYDSYCNSECF